MKIGYTFHIGNKPFRDFLSKISKLGFDYLEVSLTYPWPFKLSHSELNLFKNIKKKFGLDLAFHSPWGGVQIFHPQEKISKASFEIIEDCLKFSEKFEGNYFNLHQTIDVPNYFFVKEEIEKKKVKVSLEIARKFKIPITFENTPKISLGTPNQFEFIKKSKKLFFTFDVGHVFMAKKEIESSRIEELKREDLSIENWFRKFKKKILVVHLHDYILEEKSLDHLVLGQGKLKLEEIFEKIRKTSCKFILLEIFYSLRGKIKNEEIKRSLELVRNFFG